MNILPAGAGQSLHSDGSKLALGVRPEELSLVQKGGLQATVESITFHGEETILKLRGPSDVILRSVVRGRANLPDIGENVRLGAAVESLHAFSDDGQRKEITQ